MISLPPAGLPLSLAALGPRSHAPWMFVKTGAEAATIRAAFDRGGKIGRG